MNEQFWDHQANSDSVSPCQVVRVTWVDEDKAVNIGIRSVIDGKAMDGITSFRIHSGPDMTQDR